MAGIGGKRTFRIARLLPLATNKAEFDEAGIRVVGNPCGKAIEGPVGSAVCQNDRHGLTRSNNLCRRMAFRNCCLDGADPCRRAFSEWQGPKLLGGIGYQQRCKDKDHSVLVHPDWNGCNWEKAVVH